MEVCSFAQCVHNVSHSVVPPLEIITIAIIRMLRSTVNPFFVKRCSSIKMGISHSFFIRSLSEVILQKNLKCMDSKCFLPSNNIRGSGRELELWCVDLEHTSF